MGQFLSQEEIDALLGPTSVPEGAPRASGAGEAAVPYDLRRPERATREQMRSLHSLHDRFARNVSTSLSAYLRTVTEVGIVSVEQFTYAEFLMSLPDPTAYHVVDYMIHAGDVDPSRLSAAGYSQFHPRVVNDSEENRARNRRTDIIILNTATRRAEEPARR
jgi:Flagellar motor switch protein FliM